MSFSRLALISRLGKLQFNSTKQPVSTFSRLVCIKERDFRQDSTEWPKRPYSVLSHKCNQPHLCCEERVFSTSQRYSSIQKKQTKLKEWMYTIVGKAESWLEHVSPGAKSYLDFLGKGAQTTWNDIKTWRHTREKQKVNPNVPVSYEEEMKIYLLKKDAVKLIYLLPFCCVPFGFVMLVIPIYFFPRYVLPHTFWSETQRKTFYSQAHQERSRAYDIILHHMNYHKMNDKNSSVRYCLENITSTISSGNVPSNPMLLQLRDLCKKPFSPFALDDKKVFVLLRSFCKVILVHSIQPHDWMCSRLVTHGKLILCLDQNLRNGNILDQLKTSDIETAALIRGLNSANLSKKANLYWMNNWLELTKSCNSDDYWFVLHAMVLLSVNYSELKYQRNVFG